MLHDLVYMYHNFILLCGKSLKKFIHKALEFCVCSLNGNEFDKSKENLNENCFLKMMFMRK